MRDWKDCEGQLLDAKYPLEQYIGGDETSALFYSGVMRAAIRIRRADAAQRAALLAHWDRVKLLRHPYLQEIEAAGASVLAGEPVAYLVMENGEENLGEILQQRPLTTAEAREMLMPVASALSYLHHRGVAHGDVKASNVLAIANTVKLSSDSAFDGDPAQDIRALGLTLIHALTGRLETPAADVELPAPFAEIARGCLDPDPTVRWSADQVVASLKPAESTALPLPSSPSQSAKRAPAKPMLRRLAAPACLAIGVAVATGLVMRWMDHRPRPTSESRPTTAAVAAVPVPSETTALPKTFTPVPLKPKPESSRDRLVMKDEITHRVLPKVPEKARNTIDGNPAVVVRVTVDAAGTVTKAAVERSFSPYFSKLVLDAARRWKFVADDHAPAREWVLRFDFTQTKTEAVARRASTQ
jgi:TonB family protein